MPIKLKKHNEEAYGKIQENLKNSNRVAVIHPTGTGKSFLALKLLEENKDKKSIYVAPSNAILHNVKKNIFESKMDMSDFPNLKRITYQKLISLSKEEIAKLDADIIILDEFHHCGAPEWGAGIDRLLRNNPNAQVLGLSATPIRYFDKARDMAEELFGDNIASEMSLEEAIETGILPKATYVSALYRLDEELERIKSDIEKIKDPDKKIKAQKEFENLTKRLDENTKNLPNLLAKHMKNKNGKYIVFCRNIEDMQEKMEQAQAMFGDVNSNITTYAVSSKLKDNEKVLSKFEQDNDEGILKLMYAVDMLNEGYHINDLDGVVMMRPTYSPTIYAQQLGRALTVKGKDEKEPVIIDLVNNFDSIKIIEDLYERLKQYKPTGEHTNDKEEQSRITIHDTTKEFREIAKKITELSKRDKITLQEKIEIYERYFEEGNQEIDGQTFFEGYPIGQWAIQMRASLKRADGQVNPTEEQLAKLGDMGILERQIESTIDEKIDALVEWSQKYPNARVWSKITEDILREYVSADEEYEQLREQSEKMSRYYEYIRARKSKGKLTEEQVLRCKNGNVRGVFGYSTETEELAKKYGHSVEDIDYIISKYGSLQNFKELFRHEGFNEEQIIAKYGSAEKLIELRHSFDGELAKKILKTDIDIDLDSKIGYAILSRAIFCEACSADEIQFYSSKRLKEALEELTHREKEVIELRCGLLDGDSRMQTFEEVAQKLGVTRKCVRDIELKALRRLRKPSIIKKHKLRYGFNADHISDDAKICLKELFDSDILLYNNSYELSEKDIDNPNILETFRKMGEENFEDWLYKKEKKVEIDEVKTEETEIDETTKMLKQKIVYMGFSVRTYHALDRAHITRLEELTRCSEEDIRKIRNLGAKSFNEIEIKLASLGLSLGMVADREVDKSIMIQEIETLDFTVRTYKVLKRVGIDTVRDLVKYSEEEIIKIRNLNQSCFKEIKAKLDLRGLSLGMELDRKAGNPKDKEIERLDAEERRLQDEYKEINEKTRQAKDLANSYNKLMSGNKTNTNNEAPNFEDE